MNKSIFINQIGYKPNSTKIAYVRGGLKDEVFFIVDNKGVSVYSGKLNAPVEDRVAGEPICTADFSEFTGTGEYRICMDEAASSVFPIGNGLFDDLYYSILNYFYLSRCGENIEGEDWSHDACHTGIAEIYGTGLTKNVQGGWHDAGDYGRYVVAGAKTIMDLLLAYEVSGTKFNRFDILKEVRFELEWMLQMQRDDGAVYHKISCYHFCPFILPQLETDKLVLAPVSTAATADFAGCLAYAAQFYEESDKAFAETLVAAAIKAQDYLDTHKDELYKNPPEITTGGYGDWNVMDERYFALCSLYVVTGKKAYLKKAMEIRKTAMGQPIDETAPWKRPWIDAFSWGCVSAYGTEILLKNQDKIEDKTIIDDLKNAIIKEADRIYAVVEKSAFGTGFERAFWGSNGHVSDLAHMLLLANELTGNNKYYEAAKKQFDYILGCNPLNLCYVTGFGKNTVQNPHHRPSGAIGKCMPGMLAGGPAEGLMDEVAKKHLQNKAPLQSFVDLQGSYSTNEVAIYWNSPFVYLVAKIGLI